MARSPAARARPFRGELPAAGLVRELAAEGIPPRRAAAALSAAARALLCGEDPSGGSAEATLAANALALFAVSLIEGTPGALTPEWLEDFHRLSRPDADHKRHGRWYTARPIARAMARLALAECPEGPEPLRVMDPACGCGALLVPMLEALADRAMALQPDRPPGDVVGETLAAITAADVDAEALETCAFRLRIAARRIAGGPVNGAPRLYRGDTLLADPADVAPGGVDVVVMNPPYLGNRYFEALPDPARARLHLRRAFGWNDDLYVHFLHRAWAWLCEGGVLCALTSDTFLAIPSKARVREALRRRRLRALVRVPASAFAASVNTCITVTVHAPPRPSDAVLYLDARGAPEDAWERLEADPSPAGVENARVPASAWMGDVPFFHPTPRAIALFERYLDATGDEDGPPCELVPLSVIAPARDCGINSGNVRHRLFHADEAPGRARLIQGRQLERYVARWESPAAQFRWVDLAYRPDPSIPGLGRGGRPSRLGETWGFRGRTEAHTAAERLLLRQTEDDLFAAYLAQDPADPIYTDNTLFTLLLSDEGRRLGVTYHYLLGLLNSTFLNELYHALSQEEGRSQAQVKVGYVNRLPIAIPGEAARREIERWTREAIAAQTDGKPLTAIQWHLDSLIEELYATDGMPPRAA